ncbi:type III secretion system inner membrane ring subunit SctD [Candidatus Chlamydia sanziniae]|uniref:Forkhead domain protein n=1 Tax=Candidatus Chlamydia sanziniae TaxID=1806891 RepID=A0A1A9HUZ5_9CHLA|nr:type III secretion system inner membrane ring subunit SctD [Candidatus Chlamydia sanziniae]ANH78517.1 Forkhead domain protein [Candidatus Chlamydia sanziniae]
MAVRLVIDKGPLSGVIFILEDGDSWSIGRDPQTNDIPLEDPALASTQAVISKTDSGYFITNLDDAAPISINGITIKETTQLQHQDVLILGSNYYSFLLDEFDAEDIVYDFTFPEQNFSNVDAISDDNKKQGMTKQETRGHSKENSQKNTPSNQNNPSSITDKDQQLADTFLTSAKANKEQPGKKIDIESMTTPPPPPAKNNKKKVLQKELENQTTQNAPREDDKASPKNLPSKTASQDSSKNKSPLPPNVNEKPEEALQPRSIDKPQVEADHKENPKGKEEDPTAEEKVINDTKAKENEHVDNTDESVGDQDVKTEDEEEGNKKDSDPDKSDPDKKDTEQKEETKDTVLIPFSVHDLFRFDQEIFPAEIENHADKSLSIDLSQPSRFLLKVLAGANIGAEFHLDTGKSYILGTDPETCDIVFNDLSVSHQHAKITVGNDGSVNIEDLSSKNRVIVEGRKIEHIATLSPNQVVALGTTLFLLIDHQAPADTITASFSPEDYGLFGRHQNAEDLAERAAQEEEEKQKRATLPTGAFILTVFIGGLAILFGIATASLFHTKEVVPLENIDYQEDLTGIVNQFPTVRYTFNKTNNQLFLIGHVKNSTDKSELLYKIDALSFVKSVEENVIDDEAVWQEMNILLSKRPEFKGISMHSPEPGKFVITGYVKTEEQAACLVDYLNLHFNYLSLLENKVVIETQMLKAIAGHLLQAGFANIHVAFVNGEVILTGYVNNDAAERFRAVVQELSNIPGVRLVKNFAVLLPAEEGVIDLNLRYPNRYRVTGYSKYRDISINVVVNGRILTRGDVIDGMTVTSIQPNAIFLEKEGLKYKIEYNK